MQNTRSKALVLVNQLKSEIRRLSQLKHAFDPFLFFPPVTAIYPMLLLYVLLAKITFYVLGGCADFLQDF